MKKIVCILLAFTILLTVFAVSVSASEKIHTWLAQRMEDLSDDDVITVRICLKYDHTEKEVEQLALYRAGLTYVPQDQELYEEYATARSNVVLSLQRQDCCEFIEKMGWSEDCIHGYGQSIITADLNKAQIEQAAAAAEVDIIYCDVENTAPTEVPTESYGSSCLFRQRFESASYSYYGVVKYDELYYHYNTEGEIDWVLVNGEFGMGDRGWKNYYMIGNRLALINDYSMPFSYGYGIYDVKRDRFCEITDTRLFEESGFSKTEIIQACDEYIPEGRLLGDIDNNGELSVIDVTILQRCLAYLKSFPDDDEILWEKGVATSFRSLIYYSDFNRDGDRDVIDATCIQRYLAGLPYPIG